MPPHLNHSISSKRLGVWSSCFVTFLSLYFPLRKVQLHQSALMFVAIATMQLFGLFLKTQIAIAFQVFPPERNFLWDNLLCFGHNNTLRNLIIANIRTVTMEKFQKIISPNMVIDTKTTDKRHASQSINSILRHRNPLRCFVIVYYYIFSSFKCFELSYCSSTDFDGLGGTREQLNIPLLP